MIRKAISRITAVSLILTTALMAAVISAAAAPTVTPSLKTSSEEYNFVEKIPSVNLSVFAVAEAGVFHDNPGEGRNAAGAINGTAGEDGWILTPDLITAENSGKYWLKLSFPGVVSMDEFQLYSRIVGGNGIPKRFKIEVQKADDSWFAAVDYSASDYPNHATDVLAVHCLKLSESVQGKAVRLTAIEFDATIPPNDAPLWISEFAVINNNAGVRSANLFVPTADSIKDVGERTAPKEGNFAATGTATAPNHVTDTHYSPQLAISGPYNAENIFQYFYGGYVVVKEGNGNHQYFQIDFKDGEAVEFNSLILWPRGTVDVNANTGFPKNYTVSVQLEDGTWVMVRDNRTVDHPALPLYTKPEDIKVIPQILTFGNVKAKALRLDMLAPQPLPEADAGLYDAGVLYWLQRLGVYKLSAALELSSLSVSKGQLSPAFSPVVTDYTVNVDSSTDKITLNASADTGITITGAGEKSLSYGENKFKISLSSSYGTGEYSVTVNRKSDDGSKPGDESKGGGNPVTGGRSPASALLLLTAAGSMAFAASRKTRRKRHEG